MKPYVNKWKFIIHPVLKVLGDNQVSKSSIRQHAKKEIEKDLEYYYYYHMPFYKQPWDFEDYKELINEHQ